MSTEKLRVITDFEKLSVELQEQIKLVYPTGFSKHLIRFQNKNNETVSALPFETFEKIYLIRMSTDKARQIIEKDSDFDEEGILKEDIKVTDDEEEADEDDLYLYEWDPEFFKKRYRIPKFREKIEGEIKKYEDLLQSIDDSDHFKSKRRKFSKKINSMLKKPEELLTRIMDEFTKRVDVISPYYDYLDTNERKIIEQFEKRSSEYRKILNDLQFRSEFNFK